MEEEMLLANQSGTLFPDRGDSLVESSDSDNSDLDFTKLIEEAIAQKLNNTVDNKNESAFNDTPEESSADPSVDTKGIKEKGDTIEGTDDDDLISVTSGNKSIFGKKGKDDIKGSRDKDKIYGGKDDDKCHGDDGDDEIRGDSGKDNCDGGSGNDSIFGGKGNDTITGGSGNDTCKGDDDDDFVYGNDGNDDVDGGSGSDNVYGGKGNDTSKGGEGNDTVRGDLGNDNCDGGTGNDQVNGGKGDDTVVGGIGDDTCMGDDGDDSVTGGEGKDTIMGGAGKDTCMGDDGDDSIVGGADDDSLMGGAGNDMTDGGDGDDTVMGGGGDDTCMGGAGNDTIVAGDGNDMTDGGDGDDSVVGGGLGDDTLMGGNGNDTIVGGTGNHTCTGGAGDDIFVISDRTSGPNSVITDFTENDKFLVSGSLNFSSLSFVQVGVNTEIRGSSNFVLALLLNINASILKAASFLGVTVSPPNNTVTTLTPINTPPRLEANNDVILGSGKTQTITSSDLKFFDREQSPNVIIFTLTELPPATSGKLFLKGVEVTQLGLTFSQADINAGSLTFQGVASFTGAVSFGFKVTDGKTTVTNQKFSLNVVQTVFNFAGNTAPQVIVGSAIDDDIEGGDGDDDIKAGKGSDKIKGGKGKNKIKGDEGEDDIEGGDDEDSIEGGIGSDKIIGGAGNDTLTGNEGDDSIEGGEGTNILTGGAGKTRYSYKKSREGITKVSDADLITDFKVDDDVLEFSNAAFGFSAASFTRIEITASSVVGSIGSNNLLDFSTDTTVTSIATLQARFRALGGNSEQPVFCQFTDAETGRNVLVFSVGVRFEIVASFSVKFSFKVSNFVFTGPPLNLPVGTPGPDNVNFSTSPAGIKFDGLAGDDNIVGSNFSDSINGGDGNDTITGGLGADLLTGGSGADIFAYTTTKEGGDKILDFKSGVDKLQFVSGAFGNLTTTNFDAVSGSVPDITGKELVIFTQGTYATVEAAQAKALGSSTTPGFFVFTNAANETVLVFDSNGTAPGGSTTVANFGTAAVSLGTSDFVFTGSLGSAPPPPPNNSIVDLNAPNNTYPVAFNNFGSGAGGYNFSGPVLFIGNDSVNNVTGTAFADILNGGSGADIISGGSGADTLNGGIGADLLTGGSGADIFVYNGPLDGGDTITDFAFGVDKLQFVSGAFGNLTTTNFDAVSGSVPDITGKELVIFTQGTYATVEAAQAKALGSSTTPGFFVFTNAANETVLVFDSNGTAPGGSTTVANFGTAAVSLGTSDFVFTGSLGSAPPPPPNNSIVDLNAPNNTYPVAFNNFGSGAGGYNFSGPVLFIGNDSVNNVTGTAFADILNGGSGADIISGGSGADTLNGGIGADLLTGGSGADIFVYNGPLDGGDTITDFAFGVDKLQFVSGAFGNLTTTNFDAVSGSVPDITGKELVIFTQGTYATVEAAQAKALGSSTTPGFFVFTNAANETVLVFDSNGTAPGGSTTVANFGTAAVSLGTSDFVFTGSLGSAPAGNTTVSASSSVVDLTAAGNTYPSGLNNFGSGAGGYNFSGPVLFTGNESANTVIGTPFADIITGGSGVDILTGGSGADLFVYKAPGEGGDTITDFTAGVDKLQFVSGAFGNLTTTNFDAVSGSAPDVTGKELVIFSGGTYATVEAAQAKALGTSTTPGFFVFTNAANETVLVFDSNGTAPGGSTTVANFGTAAVSLGTSDFVFTGSLGSAPAGNTTVSASGSVVDLTAAGNTFPVAINNFGSGAGGYNFTTPVLFTGNSAVNNVTGTDFADILNGGSGADIFNGGLGNDSLSGDDGNDSLFGGPGNDTINGGAGNDTLIGGLGTNVLNGGAGSDVFVFSGTSVGGGDLITNYSTADDVINLDKTGFAAFTTGSGPLGSSFYAYSSTVATVSAIESTLTGPSIIALYDGAVTKLYYDSNGSTVGGNSLFATVDVNLGASGNSKLFLF
ncbi:MAG: cadherin-like domain-containing protein [Microcoleus anatoxicus]|uniref:cadherin-like domain-containing protein n=1 Tax=Microcoleus anatoxicus TaxID=2705319 RepID=UPI00366E33A9